MRLEPLRHAVAVVVRAVGDRGGLGGADRVGAEAGPRVRRVPAESRVRRAVEVGPAGVRVGVEQRLLAGGGRTVGAILAGLARAHGGRNHDRVVDVRIADQGIRGQVGRQGGRVAVGELEQRQLVVETVDGRHAVLLPEPRRLPAGGHAGLERGVLVVARRRWHGVVALAGLEARQPPVEVVQLREREHASVGGDGGEGDGQYGCEPNHRSPTATPRRACSRRLPRAPGRRWAARKSAPGGPTRTPPVW